MLSFDAPITSSSVRRFVLAEHHFSRLFVHWKAFSFLISCASEQVFVSHFAMTCVRCEIIKMRNVQRTVLSGIENRKHTYEHSSSIFWEKREKKQRRKRTWNLRVRLLHNSGEHRVSENEKIESSWKETFQSLRRSKNKSEI